MLRITSVTTLEDYWLRLTLNDGQVIDRYVGDAIWGVVFKSIRTDPAVFAAAYIDSGAVSWPGGADLDPEVTIWGGPPPADPSARPVNRLRLGRRAGARPVVA